MILPLLVVVVIVISYVVISDSNIKRKEAKGICTTTGGTCTSPTGCTCGETVEG